MMKSKVSKIRKFFQGMGIALLPLVLAAGCGVTGNPKTVTHAPTLSAISPNSGTQGQNVSITLTGTSLASGATIALSGTGITAGNISAGSDTQITATLAIAANAPTGPQNVTVTNSAGTSGAQVFTVNLLPATVSSTNPANGATAVQINRKITATFSKGMDPATLTTATFMVTGTSSIAGVVTYDTTNNIATFAPAANLPSNAVLIVTVTASAKDIAGNGLVSGGSAPNPWTFTTGSVVDATKPTVSSTSPASGATSVALNQAITATFSKTMDSTTISATTFTLKQTVAGTAVAGTVTYAGTTATFSPSAALVASIGYTATVTTGAKDTAGNVLASGGLASNPWTFTTGAAVDNTPPTVTSTIPAGGAVNVPINQSITATFSKMMDPATITTGTFTVAGPGTTSVNGTVTYDVASKVAAFTPATNLASSAMFSATVSTGAKDTSGHALATNKVWTFTTGSVTAGQLPVNLASVPPISRSLPAPRSPIPALPLLTAILA